MAGVSVNGSDIPSGSKTILVGLCNSRAHSRFGSRAGIICLFLALKEGGNDGYQAPEYLGAHLCPGDIGVAHDIGKWLFRNLVTGLLGVEQVQVAGHFLSPCLRSDRCVAVDENVVCVDCEDNRIISAMICA